MNRNAVCLATMIVVLVLSASGRADTSYEEYEQWGFPCGTVQKDNNSAQYGEYAWVQFTVSTTGSLDICGQWFVTTSASVSGVEGSAVSKTGTMYSSVQKQVPVPNYNQSYTTNGTHNSTTSVPFYSITQHSQSTADVGPPPDEGSGDENDCEAEESGGGFCGNDGSTPIVVDVRRDGYTLTSPADGVFFDLNADGIPEQTAWTHPDSDDAFLAFDRDGNGRIDSGAELFGNHTPAFPTPSDVTALNGFEALRFLEWAGYGTSASRADLNEILTSGDAAFSRMWLWRDVNHNGISEPEELSSLGAAGVAAIRTDYKAKRRIDEFGNEFRWKAIIEWADGVQAPVYDVWFRRQ